MALALLVGFDFAVERADDLDGLGGKWLGGFALVAVIPEEPRLLGRGEIRDGLIGQKSYLSESMFCMLLRQTVTTFLLAEGSW